MPKEKRPDDNVKIIVNSNEVFSQLKQQFVVYQIDGRTYQVPVGKLVTVERRLAEVALNAGDITEIIE